MLCLSFMRVIPQPAGKAATFALRALLPCSRRWRLPCLLGVPPAEANTLCALQWKVAPALAAGNSIVLKPSETASLTNLELAAIIDEVGLPPGVFNLLVGLGKDCGAPLRCPAACTSLQSELQP